MKTVRRFFHPPPIDTKRLSIHGIGVQEVMKPCMINRPAGTGDYLFMFFYNPVLLTVSGESEWRAHHTLMLWEPEDSHRYGNPERLWNHSWIHCDGRSIGPMLKRARLQPRSPIRLPDPSLVEKPLLEILEECAGHPRPDARIAENLLENFLRGAARAARGEKNRNAPPPELVSARHFIEENFSRHLSLDEISSRAHLSVPHFCSEFRRHFGITAIDYCIRLRLHRAAYLLRDRNASITEVAATVGYDDIYYFSKLFKKHFGQSPRTMRKALLSRE